LSVATAKNLARGAVAGVLATYLARDLGILDVVGLRGPWTALLLLTIGGALLGLVRREIWLVWIDLGLLFSTIVIATTPLVEGPAVHWVRQDQLPASPLDAIVVLSADVNSDSALSSLGTDRLLTGLQLLRAGVAPRLVTTRITEHFGPRRISTDTDQDKLAHLAGAESVLVVGDSVASTREEAERTARALLPSRSRIAVVSSPMHTRRACATFEGVGFRVYCVPARESEHVTWHPVGPGDRLAAFRAYLYERLGMVKYRAKGWVP
jgi:uncharacterized SAM-binding protein YcdF (DUF218 family)